MRGLGLGLRLGLGLGLGLGLASRSYVATPSCRPTTAMSAGSMEELVASRSSDASTAELFSSSVAVMRGRPPVMLAGDRRASPRPRAGEKATAGEATCAKVERCVRRALVRRGAAPPS